jgi:ABC-type polysaccharide/polyol phosphate transport system ATPase subunit
MRPSVIVEDVTKIFRISEAHDSLRDLVPSLFRRKASAIERSRPSREFLAVDQVSFVVGEGEALGIIGANGAGKSTILKLLNGILVPNRGKIRLRGRSTALIEVSAGFHPDLTGRENIFLQGAILGMPPAQLRPRLESIVDFAGVDRFIDTPVKRYSSGMNARLGFAIAAHLDPDVLLIDEVLAVGDMAFQQKCLIRMREFKREGVAIVFVSHNMQAVGELCDRAILLQSKVLYEGDPSEAIRRYLANSEAKAVVKQTDGYRLQSVSVSSDSGLPLDQGIPPGTRIGIRLTVEANHPPPDLLLGMVCRRATDGLVVYDGNFPFADNKIEFDGPGNSASIAVNFAAHLTRGLYSIELFLYEGSAGLRALVIPNVALIRVDEQRTYQGIADLDVSVRTSCAREPKV